MSRIVLSEAESLKRSIKKFNDMKIEGTFFRVQIGCSQYNRLFITKCVVDEETLNVIELSSTFNMNAFLNGGSHIETLYKYSPRDCVNIIHTKDPESTEAKKEYERSSKMMRI